MRAGGVGPENVAELRERPKQLAELDRLTGRELTGLRDAVERIRHRDQRVWHERLVLRIELIDVDRRLPVEIFSGETGVAAPSITPPRNSRSMSTEYCCTFGVPLFGRRIFVLAPTFVSMPSELPEGCTNVPGNGSLSDVIGTPDEDC